jgi:hypothetical protein
MHAEKYIFTCSKYICLIFAFFAIQNAWSQNSSNESEILGTVIPKGFDSSVSIQYQCNHHGATNNRSCSVVLYEFKDNGSGKYKHDSLSINLQKEYKIMDTDDTNCVSAIYKDVEIIVVAKLRKDKNKFIAYDFVKAWVIDPKTMKFKSIEKNTVSCSIIEDRN